MEQVHTDPGPLTFVQDTVLLPPCPRMACTSVLVRTPRRRLNFGQLFQGKGNLMAPYQRRAREVESYLCTKGQKVEFGRGQGDLNEVRWNLIVSLFLFAARRLTVPYYCPSRCDQPANRPTGRGGGILPSVPHRTTRSTKRNFPHR